MAMKDIRLGILSSNNQFISATSVQLDTTKRKLSDIAKVLQPKIPVEKSISEYRFTNDTTGQGLANAKWHKWSDNKDFKGDLNKGGYLQIKLKA